MPHTRKATLTAALFSAAACISVLNACGGGPTNPANPSGGAFMTTVELTGPATIEPGGTAAFKMMSTWSDGSKRDVTTEAHWISSRPDIVSISATGVATAHERGTATISASLNGRSASRGVGVLPIGTYQLSGIVTEGANIPVWGARVEAISDAGTLTATTAQDGAFTLHGVGPPTEVRVSKEGYATHVQPVAFTEYSFLAVSLKPNGPALDISGTYTLTIQAEGCGSSMREELRRRTYTAVVTQQPNQVATVTLSGADFSVTKTKPVFFGSVGAAGVLFRLLEGDAYYGTPPPVTERLPDATFLMITGLAFLTPSPEGLRGTLSGAIVHMKTFPLDPTLGQCASSAHGFVMTRV